MVLVSQSTVWWHAGIIFAAVALTSLLAYIILAGADRVRRYLGESGIRILMRIMGLLLTAIAVQFILTGLSDAGVTRGVSQVNR